MRRTLTHREIGMISGLSDAGEFRTKAGLFVEAMLARAEPQAWHPKVMYGVRSKEEQMRLYRIGREQVGGVWKRIEGQKVVTNARPGESPHNYGLAIDLALLDDKTQKWIDDAHAAWGEMEHVALELGLVTGNRWRFRDSAHCEHPSWRELKESESSR